MEATYLMRKRCDQNSFHESLSSSDDVTNGHKLVLPHYIIPRLVEVRDKIGQR